MVLNSQKNSSPLTMQTHGYVHIDAHTCQEVTVCVCVYGEGGLQSQSWETEGSIHMQIYSAMCRRSTEERASLHTRTWLNNPSQGWNTYTHTNTELTSQQVAGWRTSKSKHHQQMFSVHWPGFDPIGLLTWSRNGSGLKNSEHVWY